jgi:hypothetical protein
VSAKTVAAMASARTGGGSASVRSVHTGKDFRRECGRAVRLVRAVRDFNSCAPDELHMVLLEPHSRSTKASRDAGPVFLNTNPQTKRLHSRRCGCRPLPKQAAGCVYASRKGS